MGECYGEDNMKKLQSLGFDYTYDKELFDRLRVIFFLPFFSLFFFFYSYSFFKRMEI
jgi:hypothetical protein